eukprot:PhM_4_TR9081/c0_g1_i2/m.92508
MRGQRRSRVGGYRGHRRAGAGGRPHDDRRHIALRSRGSHVSAPGDAVHRRHRRREGVVAHAHVLEHAHPKAKATHLARHLVERSVGDKHAIRVNAGQGAVITERVVPANGVPRRNGRIAWTDGIMFRLPRHTTCNDRRITHRYDGDDAPQHHNAEAPAQVRNVCDRAAQERAQEVPEQVEGHGGEGRAQVAHVAGHARHHHARGRGHHRAAEEQQHPHGGDDGPEVREQQRHDGEDEGQDAARGAEHGCAVHVRLVAADAVQHDAAQHHAQHGAGGGRDAERADDGVEVGADGRQLQIGRDPQLQAGDDEIERAQRRHRGHVQFVRREHFDIGKLLPQCLTGFRRFVCVPLQGDGLEVIEHGDDREQHERLHVEGHTPRRVRVGLHEAGGQIPEHDADGHAGLRQRHPRCCVCRRRELVHPHRRVHDDERLRDAHDETRHDGKAYVRRGREREAEGEVHGEADGEDTLGVVAAEQVAAHGAADGVAEVRDGGEDAVCGAGRAEVLGHWALLADDGADGAGVEVREGLRGHEHEEDKGTVAGGHSGYCVGVRLRLDGYGRWRVHVGLFHCLLGEVFGDSDLQH